MDSPSIYPESPMEQDDIVYPCKGCGEILEEGKAFELAGNRWHIDCFACNTCGTLLDSDANLLLLGDGSLICNNCTYSCNACGNKIEDLAILTGDQAFCANCFKCRNCKRRIENLRYARTSQGIFCMSCHESLMARRRKKSKAALAARAREQQNASASAILDKSLPALPPSAPDIQTPPPDSYAELTPEVSPRPRVPKPRKETSPSNFRRDASPAAGDDFRRDNNLTLPASTYRENRNSTILQNDGGDDGIFLPFALDPNMAPGPSPMGKPQTLSSAGGDTGSAKLTDAKPSRDYFNNGRLPSGSSHRDMLKEPRPGSSRSNSTERFDKDRQQQLAKSPASPHIAYQEKGRQASGELLDSVLKRKDLPSGSNKASPAIGQEKPRSQHASSPSINQTANSDSFKLQDVPKLKRTSSRRGSNGRPPALGDTPQIDVLGRAKSPADRSYSATPSPEYAQSPPPQDLRRRDESYSSTKVERPKREDSLPASTLKQAAPRRDVPPSPATPTAPTGFNHERKQSTSSLQEGHTNLTAMNGGRTISKPIESPTFKSMSDAPGPPARSGARPPPPGTQISDSFTAPRAPPPPPGQQGVHRPSESVSTVHSETSRPTENPISPTLPRYSHGGEFSMDEDMARIMRGEDLDKDSSVLRRVSNAMSKHGRSFSDRGSRTSQSAKLKNSLNGVGVEISSPTTASPDSKEEVVQLKNNLRRAQQIIAELETKNHLLREEINGSPDMKQMNTELREKRSTVAVLDTQREIAVRELESMIKGLEKVKNSNEPINIQTFQSEFLQDLGSSLEKLKSGYANQIEDLIRKKNELTNEISELIQMKDKGNSDYDALAHRNNQLQQMNARLMENIQETSKQHKGRNGTSIDGGRPTANGLGIYTHHHKDKSDLSMDLRSATGPDGSLSDMLRDHDGDAAVSTIKVVDIKKAGKSGKFGAWKKGQTVTKNLTKNIKGAFTQPNREDGYSQQNLGGVPYGSLPSNTESSTTSSIPKTAHDPSRTGFGFFNQKGNYGRPQAPQLKSQSSTNLEQEAKDPRELFGSDLIARCEFEGTTIPNVVVKCVVEVDTRGLDCEGIYRKSGSTTSTNAIVDGFQADKNYDISDPDLDINAVASVLKQYFRKLAFPLITNEVYDPLIDASKLEDVEKRAVAMRTAIEKLPQVHLSTLFYIVEHLNRVMKNEADNKMPASNLAVVFAPTLFRPLDVNKEMRDMHAKQLCMQYMLEDYMAIFKDLVE
ncbi:RhoGAP-domain-containing protein [Patellaria atrata CBS 101060]|uniref:RhoGAP-domain-containing protein n=1 Tax=Patellaria atrata CBS 101060 TaxID=1346257 RepID=A0A9P4VN10_9PEZI|nr:RhoGAP-domain-containing protein [Patellaria atrata CBS 101060]